MIREMGSTKLRSRVKSEQSSSKTISGAEMDTRSIKSGSSSASVRTAKTTARTPYCPPGKTAFATLLIVRLTAALFSNISDCDEVFNYWEPTHYLQYGFGMQTWEYSPKYAIRSWAYIQLHLFIGNVFNFLFNRDKIKVFYAIRVTFAVVCSICETLFYLSAVNNLGPRVGRYLIMTMLISTGTWNASTAYLPSTFAMYTTMIAFFYALKPVSTTSGRRIYLTIFWIGLGSLLAWPFSAAVGIPAAIEELVLRTAALKGRFERIKRLIVGFLFSTCIILIPLVLIDYFYYKKITIVPLNIVMYNVFSGKDRGPDIYGTEPWYFYVMNGFLNFNFLFLMALISIPGLILTSVIDNGRISSTSTVGPIYAYLYLTFRLLPFYLWLFTFIIQPHKEERFLFVIYPLICLNSAVAIFLIRGWLDRLLIFLSGHMPYCISARRYCMKLLTTTVIIICGAISLARIFALYVHYSAPMTIFKHFYYVEIPNQIAAHQSQVDLLNNPINLCIGKEWHRFPSHFFLPDGVRLRFLKSDFNGQLPKYFLEKTYIDFDNKTKLSAERIGTWTIQEGFNDRNLEEMDRYFNVAQCDYIIDLDTRAPLDDDDEQRYVIQTAQWNEVICRPFLNAENSNRITRAFYLPPNAWQKLRELIGYLPPKLANSVTVNTLGNLKWGDYCLLRRKK